MNSYDVGPESFYFLEILDHGFPIITPIVFEQGSTTVVVVVDAPDNEWFSRASLNEPFVVRTYFDPFELGRICRTNTCGGQAWGKTCPTECQETLLHGESPITGFFSKLCMPISLHFAS
ncbi:MAG: hypothetical protein QNL93_00140 [Opitutae bacterium]